MEWRPVHGLTYVEHRDVATEDVLHLCYEFPLPFRDIVVDEERQPVIALKLNGFVLNGPMDDIGLFGTGARVCGSFICIGVRDQGALGSVGTANCPDPPPVRRRSHPTGRRRFLISYRPSLHLHCRVVEITWFRWWRRREIALPFDMAGQLIEVCERVEFIVTLPATLLADVGKR